MKQLFFYLMSNMLMLLMVIILILISVAFLTLFERKTLSYMHYRKGPNKISLWGILQPMSDAMKLMLKEFFHPNKTNYNFYFISPMLMLTLILSLWLVYPFKTNLFNWNLNSLFILALMSMGVYGMMMAGWSSNSCFSMLGAIRSIAQSISYEVTFTISFLLSLFMINSLNLNNILYFHKYNSMIYFMWPVSMMFLLSMLAELNRTPFDLSEGESELVSGFNVEYSSHSFVLIFISEYSSIIFMSYLFNLIYLCKNSMYIMFYLTLILLIYSIIWTRVTLPRIRYDLLMFYCWIFILPLILIMFLLYMLFTKFSLEMMILLSMKS